MFMTIELSSKGFEMRVMSYIAIFQSTMDYIYNRGPIKSPSDVTAILTFVSTLYDVIQ
jgi:hypothetical protein